MPVDAISFSNQTSVPANNATNVTIVHTIDFEPLISFVSQYKWGILLVAIGIILLIRIDLVASLIAIAKSKLGKKEKKEEHKDLEAGSFSYRDFEEKGDVIDVEYEVKGEKEVDNRK